MSDDTRELHFPTTASAFWYGAGRVPRSLMCLVLFGTMAGIGALAHDTGFSLMWLIVSSLVIWAGPAQIILMVTLANGASLAQAAIAVALSGIRLTPMVVALLPQLRGAKTRKRDLILPAHFTAVTFWVETMRAIPHIPRDMRIAFCNGFGTALAAGATGASIVGFLLADHLPPLFGLAILFLAPVVFLMSMAKGARVLQDWLALGFGVVATPLAGLLNTGIDLLIGAIVAGTLAYGIGLFATQERARSDDVDPDVTAGGGV